LAFDPGRARGAGHRGMTAPARLAYVVAEAIDLAPWSALGADILGMDADVTVGRLEWRMDAKPWRLAIERGETDRIACVGWEYDSPSALVAALDRLRDAGVTVAEGDAAARGVAALHRFRDPGGHEVELCHGHADVSDPPRFPRPIGGFLTGSLGLGHIVYAAPDIAQPSAFYEAVLGFRLSDFADEPFAARFLHLNARHHSLAFVQTPRAGVHHLMVEYATLDDVGQALDRALLEEGRVAVTLGRHSNDWMTSFYMATPAGMMIEVGWGGRAIDTETWTPARLADGPSLWGHERSWLTGSLRERARALRLRAAEKGLKAPLPHQS